MVYIPISSPLYLIEFELIAFKDALASSPDFVNNKAVLIFPKNLDPVINRLIRFLASRMHLESMLIGDYEAEVVVVYPEHYFREGELLQEKKQITTQDFLRAKSLLVSGSERRTEVKFAQPSTSSSQSTNVTPLNLAIKKDSGRIETEWQKPAISQYYTESFFNYRKPYPDFTYEQKKTNHPVCSKRKDKTKWISSMTKKELSLGSRTSSPPLNLETRRLELFLNDVDPPAVASTSQEMTHTIAKPPAKPQCTEDQPLRGKRKAKTKWINSIKKKLSCGGAMSPPPSEMQKCSYVPESELYSEGDKHPPAVVSASHAYSQTIVKPSTAPHWTEVWGTHDAILLPLGYMKSMPQEVLSLFSECVPGTVCYNNKQGQPLEFPAAIYIMPPDNEEGAERQKAYIKATSVQLKTVLPFNPSNK